MLAAEEMSAGLAQLGYDLEPSEVAILMQQLDIDADGQVHGCLDLCLSCSWVFHQLTGNALSWRRVLLLF